MAGMLTSVELEAQDPDRIRFLLIRDDAYMDEVIEILHQSGLQGDITWEYADPVQADSTSADSDHSYTVYVVDQNHNPVSDVCVTFCTDKACMMAEGDENGVVVFIGDPDVYHLQIVDVPEGYSYDDGFELYTDRSYGDWVLFIRKD